LLIKAAQKGGTSVNKKLLIAGIAILILAVSIAALHILRKNNLSLPLKSAQSKSISGLIAQARSLEAKGALLDARKIYQGLVSEFFNSNEVMNWQKKIEEMNIKLLFSPVITPKSILYTVKPGDTLAKIANEFKTTADLIIKSNGLASDKIIPGAKLKVWTVPFTILVDKSQNLLFLKSGEEIFKTYIVSTGKNNCTPVGNFKIINKLLNPTWFKAGAVVPADSPDNILGTRWMGLDLAGYGIHGTTIPDSLGKQATEGCTRMSKADVEELFTIVPVGTEVTIVD